MERTQQALECQEREFCDEQLVDENCNGSVNEGCFCLRGSTVACCSGRGIQTCSGRTGLGLCSVTPVTEVCNGIDDDCDGQTDEAGSGGIWCRVDADGDLFASTTAPMVQRCADNTRPQAGFCPVGYVGFQQQPNFDCDDSNASYTSFAPYLHDADADGFCSDEPSVSLCAGAPVPPGYSVTCSGLDCDDNDASKSEKKPVRVDADGDTHCAGPVLQLCSSATTPPQGHRFVNSSTFPFFSRCNTTDDCRDSNANAGPVCVMPGAFTTTVAVKNCFGIGTPATESFTVSPVTTCPVGFTLTGLVGNRTWGGGSCNAVSATRVDITCGSFENVACNIVGTCVAL